MNRRAAPQSYDHAHDFARLHLADKDDFTIVDDTQVDGFSALINQRMHMRARAGDKIAPAEEGVADRKCLQADKPEPLRSTNPSSSKVLSNRCTVAVGIPNW